MADKLVALGARAGRVRAVWLSLLPLVVVGMFTLAGCGGSSHAAATVTASVASAQPAGNTAATPPASGTSHPGSGTTSAAPHADKSVRYEVRTSSMEPAYMPEKTVSYDPARTHPNVGDVVVFYLPVGYAAGSCGAVQVGAEPCPIPVPGLTKVLAIKRVAGLPGDIIAIHEGHVVRNGTSEPEPVTIPCGKQEKVGCELPKAITVPAGHYFLMSTNLGLYKEDSRIFGPVPQQAIVGTVKGG